MTAASLLDVRGLCLDTPAGRPLFRDLSLTLARSDRAALVGRNGAGKSALLEVLAGRMLPAAGSVLCRGRALLVPQEPPARARAPGSCAACGSRRRGPRGRTSCSSTSRRATSTPPAATGSSAGSPHGAAR